MSTIVLIFTSSKFINKHIPTNIIAQIIYGIGILPFYVYFRQNIENKRFLILNKII